VRLPGSLEGADASLDAGPGLRLRMWLTKSTEFRISSLDVYFTKDGSEPWEPGNVVRFAHT
jgi:hypothetical protein